MTSFEQLVELLHWDLFRRGALAALVTSLSCAVLGIFLVPRRFSMIGDGLAHFSLATVGLALILQIPPLIALLPATVAASFCLTLLRSRRNVPGDVLIVMVSVLGLALGAMLASIKGGFSADLLSYLFGDILLVTRADFWVVLAVCAVELLTVYLMREELLALTAAPEMARVWGIREKLVERSLAAITGLVIAIGIRVAGVMLISSFLIFPAASALLLGKSFRMVIGLAVSIGLTACLLGLLVALSFDLPTGPTMSLLYVIFFLLAQFLAHRGSRAGDNGT